MAAIHGVIANRDAHAKSDWSESLHQAFLVALLMTGSIRGAEKAIERAIDLLSPDCSPISLLFGVVNMALEQREWHYALPSSLPVELRALSVLSPTARNCFVLRALMGFNEDTCSTLLGLPGNKLREALHRSFVDLPLAIQTMRGRTASWPLI